MYLFLLKKALPFALTFFVGTALGGLTWLFGGPEKKAETIVVARAYDFPERCGNARRYKLVAETKPLVILFKPDARWPLGIMLSRGRLSSVRASVTFGADGKVADVSPVDGWLARERDTRGAAMGVWYAAEAAARQIRFRPEVVDSVPVPVEREVEIRFLPE